MWNKVLAVFNALPRGAVKSLEDQIAVHEGRAESYRAQVADALAGSETYLVKIRALERAKDRHSKILDLIKDKTGVSVKFGGAIDVDYDRLCNGLGLEQCLELRTIINAHLKKWRK